MAMKRKAEYIKQLRINNYNIHTHYSHYFVICIAFVY